MRIGKTEINLGFYMPADSKILSTEIHPVHTWMAILEEDRSVYLWDYSLKSVLRAMHSKDLDEKEYGGGLKGLKFLDPHVLRWKWLRSQDVNLEAFQGKGQAKFWLIIVMEYKIIFVDYRNGEKIVLHYSQFENKGICCIEFVDSSYMAIGFSDGSIRIFDIEDWEVVKVFPRGTHSKQITQLLSYSKNLNQRSSLISTGGDGVIAVWNVDTCTDIPAFLIPSGSATAHSNAITSISLNLDLGFLCVIGNDNVISIWNILNSTLIHKYKNLRDKAKKRIIGACFFNNPMVSPTTILSHSGTSSIYYFDSNMHTFAKDLQALQVLTDLPHGKIFNIKVHPLQPYLLFACCEEGVYTIYYDRNLNLPFGFSQYFTSQVKPSPQSGESHFMYYYDKDNLNSLIFSVSKGEVFSQMCVLQTRPMGGKLQMAVSASGCYLSVLSVASGLFDVYSVDLNPTKTPIRIKSGYSTHLVWDSASDRFGCICPLNEDDTTGSFSSVVSKILLLIYEVNNGKVCLIFRGDSMPVPVGLFGGVTLAVTEKESGNTVFYSWQDLKSISKPIPKPNDVFWTENACVVAYKTEFYVYKYKTQLEFLYKVNHSIKTAVWSYAVFFYSTDNDIYWLIPCIKTPYLLASHAAESKTETDFNIKEDKISQKISKKPQEYSSIFGIFQGHLLILSSCFKIVAIPIKSIFLRFCMLVGSGIISEAMPLTLKMQENLHKSACKVLEYVGFPQQALGLPGLPYSKFLKIAARNKIPVEIDSKILQFLPKIKKIITNNTENIEFLKTLHSVLFEEKQAELALLAAICIKDQGLLLDTLMRFNMQGRSQFRLKS